MENTMIEPLVGKVVKINRGGPNSRTGKLLSVADDFLTLLTEEDGVIYYVTRHIKSFTENSKGKNSFDMDVPLDFEYKQGDKLTSLLDSLNCQWVKINHHGPEKVEGVLHDCNDSFVVIVNNDEVIRLATFHINSISYGAKIVKRKEEKNNIKADGVV